MSGKEPLGNQRGDNQKKNLFELRHEFDHLATWMGFWSVFVCQFLEWKTAKGTGGLQPLWHVQKGKATCISVRYLCWIHTTDLGTASNYIQQLAFGLLQCLIDGAIDSYSL